MDRRFFMIGATVISVCGVFFSGAVFAVLYLIALFLPTFGLVVIAANVWIYFLSAILFSLYHGYFCASKVLKYHSLCALINGIILAAPTLFMKNSMLIVLTLVLCAGVSMLVCYTSLPKIEYKKRLEEDSKTENITDAEDYAKLQYIISTYSNGENEEK